MVSFIGYTFTMTFAVRLLPERLLPWEERTHGHPCHRFRVIWCGHLGSITRSVERHLSPGVSVVFTWRDVRTGAQCCFHLKSCPCPPLQVQGLVNTLADMRSVFAAVGRINEVTSETAVDSSLALGLEREARGEIETCTDPPSLTPSSPGVSVRAEQKLSSVCELAWAGDVVLEGKAAYVIPRA